MPVTSRHLHLSGATGAIRTTSFHGRPHIVVPVVALVEGVIHPVNAETPELVLASDFSIAPQGWNGRPVVAGHPIANGTQISANFPTVLESRSFGTIFNTRVMGKRLLMEAWLDPEKAKAVGRDAERVIERAQAGEPIEVSVGVYVMAENKIGTYEGKGYKARWSGITPDHLAMLPEGTLGACSNEMGCGVRMAQVHLVTAQGIELKEAGGAGSGNFGHSGRPGEVGGSGGGGMLPQDRAYEATKKPFTGELPQHAYPDDVQNYVEKNIPKEDLVAIFNGDTELDRKWQQEIRDNIEPSGDTQDAIDETNIYERDHDPETGKTINPMVYDPLWPHDSVKDWILTELKSDAYMKSIGIRRAAGRKMNLYERLKTLLPSFKANSLSEEERAEFAETLETLGGKGSGDFGHSGRPGEQGGSSSEGNQETSHSSSSDAVTKEREHHDALKAEGYQAKPTESYSVRGGHGSRTEFSKGSSKVVVERFGPLNGKNGPKGDHVVTKLRLSEAHLEDAAGARHSATDRQLVQDMHDKSVTLGAACTPSMYADKRTMAQSRLNTRALVGALRTATTDEAKTAAEQASYEALRTLANTAHEELARVVEAWDTEAPDLAAIQTFAQKLSGAAYGITSLAQGMQGEDEEAIEPEAHTCACDKQKPVEGEPDMDKKARVKALVDDKYTPFTAEDVAMLETASEARLTAFEAASKEAQEAAAKAEADLKAAAEGKQKAEDKTLELVAAAAKPKTEDEWLKDAPARVRDIVTRAEQAEADRKAHLVGALKTAQTAYTEDELKALELPSLEKLALVAKVETEPKPATFVGRAMPRVARTADEAIPDAPDMNERIRAASKKSA